MTTPSDPAEDAPAATDGADPVPDDLTLDRFYDVLEALERPVVTASEVARSLDVSHAAAASLLERLADEGRVESLDAEADPVVWFPRDYRETQRRERVEVFPNRREILVSQPTQFTRAQLSQFAHLEETNREGGYRYRVREADVWQAPYDEIDGLLRTMRQALGGRHEALEEWVEGQFERARKFRLVTHEDGYVVLEASSPDLLGNVAQQQLDESSLRAVISDTEAWVAEDAVATVKRTLYDAGYPVADERELEAGEPLAVELAPELRDYQQDWVDRFLDRKAGVLVGPPGSGKTVAALGVMAAIGGETLILVPGRELAAQWSGAMVEQTSLMPNQVGEYHGGSKETRPVTVATYRTAGMDRHRQLFDEREWGLIVYDECLSGDTVVETTRGRQTFEELDTYYGLQEGWNWDIDLSVRTYKPGEGYLWDEVKGVFKTTAQTKRITTNTGHTLDSTAGHKHVVYDPETCTIVEQEDVEVGDFLVQPLSEPDGLPGHRGDLQDPEDAKAELIGWFIGDGHMNQYGDVKFSFGRRPERQVEILTDLCDKVGAEYSVFENSRGDLTLWAPKLKSKIEWEGIFGDKTRSVAVPSEAYTWPPARIGALLRGLFDAEGSVGEFRGRIQFNTTSARLADDVSRLLQRLGVLTRISRIERTDENHANVSRLYLPTYYNDRFERWIGFRLEHKQERIDPRNTPATGLPMGPFFQSLKGGSGLTNEDIASLINTSGAMIGDTIRESARFGQRYLSPLADGLSKYGSRNFEDVISARNGLNISYSDLGRHIGISTSAAYGRFQRESDEAHEALLSLANKRQEIIREYAERLRRLDGLTFLEVVEIEDIGEETVYDFETESHTFMANGFLTHNCHHIPSPIYRVSADLQTRHRLGMSSTPVREDDKEAEIFTLIGPPIGTDWGALFDAGFVAEPEVEIRYVPWPDDDVANEYTSAEGHERRQLAASNPAKGDEVAAILREHPGKKALVFVEYLDQGDALAEQLGVPFVSGRTPHAERGRLFEQFRSGELTTLVVSRVGDEGLDLPSAEVAIAASGLGGSRRQGAQRAGRTMRPVGRALLYVLATRGTQEEEFARRRMRHLAGKGIRVREAPASAWE